MLTKSKTIKYILLDLSAKYHNSDNLIIWRVDDLDFLNGDPEIMELKGFKYCAFIEQSYITEPIGSHFEPIPNEFNSLVEKYLSL